MEHLNTDNILFMSQYGKKLHLLSLKEAEGQRNNETFDILSKRERFHMVVRELLENNWTNYKFIAEGLFQELLKSGKTFSALAEHK